MNPLENVYGKSNMIKRTRYRLRNWLMVVILLTASVSPVAYNASAGLKSRMQNAIFMAYMNGYVAALKLDSETIEAVKADKQLMKTVVMDAAREYVQRVEDMN